MNDIYIPKKVPRIEVREHLHGHTKIELRNVRTGRVERVEHDNFFTDGIESWLNNCGMYYNSIFQVSDITSNPVCTNLVGGVLLFDTALPTSPAAKYMPAGTKMTANGSYGVSNSSNPPELGSYNSIESSIGANSATFVYDWGTSQGNGTIAAVSLTTRDGGYIGYGNRSGSSASQIAFARSQNYRYSSGSYRDTYNGGYCVLQHNNKKYVCDYGYASSTAQITVHYDPAPVTQFDIFTPTIQNFNIAYFRNTMTFTIPDGGLATAVVAVTDTAHPNKIILVPSGGANSGASFKVYFLNVDDGTVEVVTITNNIGSAIKGDAYGLRIWFIDNTYALVVNTSNYWFKINYRTSELIGQVSGIGAYAIPSYSEYRITSSGFLLSPDLLVMGNYIYDPSENAMHPINATTRTYISSSMVACPSYDSETDQMIVKAGYRENQELTMWHNPLRLMTINNLDDAVTKDQTKTMKVTYTVTRSA